MKISGSELVKSSLVFVLVWGGCLAAPFSSFVDYAVRRKKLINIGEEHHEERQGKMAGWNYGYMSDN